MDCTLANEINVKLFLRQVNQAFEGVNETKNQLSFTRIGIGHGIIKLEQFNSNILERHFREKKKAPNSILIYQEANIARILEEKKMPSRYLPKRFWLFLLQKNIYQHIKIQNVFLVSHTYCAIYKLQKLLYYYKVTKKLLCKTDTPYKKQVMKHERY